VEGNCFTSLAGPGQKAKMQLKLQEVLKSCVVCLHPLHHFILICFIKAWSFETGVTFAGKLW